MFEDVVSYMTAKMYADSDYGGYLSRRADKEKSYECFSSSK